MKRACPSGQALFYPPTQSPFSLRCIDYTMSSLLMNQFSGEALVTTAALLAAQVAQGRSEEELSLLAAFFTCLGDNLAMIAVRLAADGGGERAQNENVSG